MNNDNDINLYVSEIYHFLPAYVWFTAALILIILAYVLEIFRRQALFRENHREQQFSTGNNYDDANSHCNSGSSKVGINFVECTSPNCVRCSNNLDIIQTAQQRLSTYFIPSDNQEIRNDVSNIGRDLKESLDSKSEFATSITVTDSYESENPISTPTLFFMRGLREKEFFSSEEFSGLDNLEDKFEQICLEFLHLYQSPLPETKSLWKVNTTDSGTWELSHLINQGKITKAGQLCPLTLSILSHLPSFMHSNLFGNAAFSVVHPQTEITRHCGSTNVRIRCHLGLQVPLEVCKLNVNATDVEWKEGEVLCFNDAFPHSVHHNGQECSGIRVVLLVDLWHPDISRSQCKLLDYIFSPTD